MGCARAMRGRWRRAVGRALVAAAMLLAVAGRAAGQPVRVPSPAAAATTVDPQAIEAFLARGRQLFDEQEYAAAIQTLSPVTRDARATRAQRLRALELIALAHFIRRDEAGARATFERILDIDPGYQLRDTSGSPKIRAFFDELKRQLIPGYDPTAGADLEHAAPTAGVAAEPVEIEVRATRGGERVFSVVVATRRRGALAYQVLPAAPRGESRWRARPRPAASAKPYILEYYLEARDAGGAAVARVGSPDAPLEIALTAGSGEGARRWYSRWYVIAAGAAVVAAGATGLVLAATAGPDAGTLPPGSVTVTE